MHWKEAGLEVEQLGLKRVPLRDTSVAGGSFTHYATVQTSGKGKNSVS